MNSKFEYQWVESRIHWYDDDSENYEEWSDYDEDCYTPTDSFREMLDEINGNCWDSIDNRGDEIICYPADSPMDMRTGDYVSRSLFIRCKRPEWGDRLVRGYYNT